ncbi:MAG TPA: ParB/RepB/Spo0J family partition protein [Tepidisphaeraceae bacterium]|nr:ParB/RepB/Spo0J family partition protein [Tepidisphaeraceae bacterium]
MLVSSLKPSATNDSLYRPIDTDDANFKKLVRSVLKRGRVMQPLLATRDGILISGHRRLAAAKVAQLVAVPCQFTERDRQDYSDAEFLELIREHNLQREKTLAEQHNEALVDVAREGTAYADLLADRQEKLDKSGFSLMTFDIVGEKVRSEISKALHPFLIACMRVIDQNRDFWPLSVRQIHYRLLGENAPLKHASKPGSTYVNDRKSYQALSDLLTRGRLVGRIPWHTISDETRDFEGWPVHQAIGPYITSQMDRLFTTYWRDRLQSQPHHVEVIGEKNTVKTIVSSVCREYTVPYSIGRGYCSIPPRYEMAQRFRRSGKDRLIVLILSDLDPDGSEIAQSFARSMRDDFNIANIEPIKVALTPEQIDQYDLPPKMVAKPTSSNYAKFVAAHGQHVFELEALEASQLQDVLRDAINRVLDIDLYNREVEAEARDADYLKACRLTLIKAAQQMGIRGLSA